MRHGSIGTVRRGRDRCGLSCILILDLYDLYHTGRCVLGYLPHNKASKFWSSVWDTKVLAITFARLTIWKAVRRSGYRFHYTSKPNRILQALGETKYSHLDNITPNKSVYRLKQTSNNFILNKDSVLVLPNLSTYRDQFMKCVSLRCIRWFDLSI